ncbi:MAG: CopG family antitoxin [Candidatus Eremiobacterota bacterium]
MKKDKSFISKSKSYKETGEFWDSHDLGEFWDKTEKADFEVDIESNITYYALDNNLSTQIQSISRQRGISPETLINLWIQEKLQTIDEKISPS